MKPIPMEYETSLCEIKSLTNDVLAKGYIKEIGETSILVANDTAPLPQILKGKIIKLNILNRQSNGFIAIAAKVRQSSTDLLTLENVIILLDHERRTYFRVKVTLRAKIYVDFEEETRSYDAMLDDISLSGAFIITGYRMKLDDTFLMEADLMEGITSFACRVCRMAENNIRRGYGCEFIGCSKKQSDMLYKYMYEKQRENVLQQKFALD